MDLIEAIQRYKGLEVIKLLIKDGIDVNDYNGYNWTPLILAGNMDRLDVVKLLIASGADINLKDKSGNSAITWAISNNNKKVLNYLKFHSRIKS